MSNAFIMSATTATTLGNVRVVLNSKRGTVRVACKGQPPLKMVQEGKRWVLDSVGPFSSTLVARSPERLYKKAVRAFWN